MEQRAALDLAADLTLALDPAALAARVGIPPDPWQARMLRSAAPRLLLNCSRQSGKSTTTGILAAHTARPRCASRGSCSRSAWRSTGRSGGPCPPRARRR